MGRRRVWVVAGALAVGALLTSAGAAALPPIGLTGWQTFGRGETAARGQIDVWPDRPSPVAGTPIPGEYLAPWMEIASTTLRDPVRLRVVVSGYLGDIPPVGGAVVEWDAHCWSADNPVGSAKHGRSQGLFPITVPIAYRSPSLRTFDYCEVRATVRPCLSCDRLTREGTLTVRLQARYENPPSPTP